MNIQKILGALLCLCNLSAAAQEAWNIDRCMAYAVEHNRTVKQRKLEADNYRLDKMKAIGQFLPGVSGSVSAQYSYGRSVDPATNTYVSQSNFNNGYGMEGSMTIFQGGSLINQVRQSRANELLGKAALQEARDNTALETFQAYIDALYYFGTTRLAEKKLLESDSLVYKTKRQEMLGLKGMADVAQMEAQQATDAYNLTHQRNLYETAMLTLKQTMNYPVEDTLVLDTRLIDAPAIEQVKLNNEQADDVFRLALRFNPTLRQSEMQKRAALMARKISWGSLFPTISIFGGISSSYYKELHTPGYDSFSRQMKNNFGSYFGVSMSIPIFDGMSRSINVKQAKNRYLIASQQYEAQKEALQKLVLQAVQDREGFLKESLQMEKKVASDSIAYRVTRRKYEEGLMTSLDVQNNAATLLESQTGLLQSKLTYVMKCRLVDYYKGEEIIRNKEYQE